MLTIAAFVVAHYILIPLEAEYLASDNLEETFTDIRNVQTALTRSYKYLVFCQQKYAPTLGQAKTC